VTSIAARIVLEELKLEGATAADGLSKRHVTRIGFEYIGRRVTLLARHSAEGFLVIGRSEHAINLEMLRMYCSNELIRRGYLGILPIQLAGLMHERGT